MSTHRIGIMPLVVLLGVLVATAGAGTPVEWDEAVGGNGHYYEYVGQTGITWTSAEAVAATRTFGGTVGHLATVTSQDENDFLVANFGSAWCDQAWLGGWQSAGMPPAEGWNWVTDEPWTYTNWAPGQPSDTGGDERFLAMWGRCASSPRRHRWNDDANDTGPQYTHGYFVEYPVPELVTVLLDIKPNSVNLKSKGLLPVVAYGTEGLDVTEIDLDLLLLNGVGPRVKPNGSWHVSFKDVDGDLLLDLVMHFEMQALGIEPGTTELSLTGVLMDGTEFEGADAIRIVPDFNGDLMVNATDLAIMKHSYGPAGVGFELGDANADGFVDATDLALLRLDLGWSEPAFGEPIPEPATLLVMAAAGLAILRRRSR